MPVIPDAMKRHGRDVDPIFLPDEQLYRRVPPFLWEDPAEEFDIESIELPDMSCVRSKHGHPEWARFDRGDYTDWGVIGCQVQHVPPTLTHLGIFRWTFTVHHAPEHQNYPHSEVRAFENGTHIHMKLSDRIDPSLHLRWREHLLRHVYKVILPQQEVEFRETAP